MLLNGFTSLLSLEMILLMFGGVVVGIIFGAIPGLSATMAIVLFLPITFNMGTTQAFALLVALYIGGVSGGLISAILINIPGSAMSIATCYDGHPMANQGHAQRALGIGVVFSFLGTVISLAIMMVAAPALASIAVKMSSFEIFSMTFCAIALVTGVGSKDVIKSLAAAFFGIALCFIGMAPVDGAIRYTFGNSRLLGGIPLTSAVVGMFAVTEILKTVGKKITADKLEQRHREKIKGFGFTFKEFVGQIKNLIISSAVGLGIVIAVMRGCHQNLDIVSAFQVMNPVIDQNIAPDQLFAARDDHLIPREKREVAEEYLGRFLRDGFIGGGGYDEDLMPLVHEMPHGLSGAGGRFYVFPESFLKQNVVNLLAGQTGKGCRDVPGSDIFIRNAAVIFRVNAVNPGFEKAFYGVVHIDQNCHA